LAHIKKQIQTGDRVDFSGEFVIVTELSLCMRENAMESDFENESYEVEDFYTFSDGIFDPPPEVKEWLEKGDIN
jgi:hypothetical protein